MTPRLRALLVMGTIVGLGGGAFFVAVSKPDTTLPELVDAGLLAGQPFVIICPERLTDKTRARVAETQPNALGPRQRYARIARPAACFRPAGAPGNCFRADGTIFAAAEGGTVVVPGLKTGGADGDDSDDAYQWAPRECTGAPCQDFDAGAGTWANFCAGPRRLAVVQPACMVPDCTRPDGTWDDNHAPVACRGIGPIGLPDGGPRWRGCTVYPRGVMVGAACLPVECGVVLGDTPGEVLR